MGSRAMEKKADQQWNEQDLRTILNDSPWAKEIQVEAPWLGFSASETKRPGKFLPFQKT